MKNIKNFKYWYSYEFEKFLKDYGYSLDDVKGFSVSSLKRYHGNILKVYEIHFNDGEYEYFRIAYFKSFNEYNQTWLGFNGNKLLHWYETSAIKLYKLNNEYIWY